MRKAKQTKSAKSPNSSKAPKSAKKARNDSPSPRKSAAKAPKKTRAKIVEGHHDTLLDTRRPVPGQKKKQARPPEKKQGWRWTDLLFTGLFIAILGIAVTGVWLVNQWSIRQGAKSVHTLSIAHVSERSRAYWLHLKTQYRPPSPRRPSLGYEKEIQAAALKFRIPANLLKAVIKVGSGFRVDHVDRYGAIGLMQITPSMGMRISKAPQNLFRVSENIKSGALYLRQILDQKPDFGKALIAYYAGMRKLPVHPSQTDGPPNHFAWKVMRAMQRFQKDPGQEIRRASQRNRQAPTKKRRSWIPWKRLKALVKQ